MADPTQLPWANVIQIIALLASAAFLGGKLTSNNKNSEARTVELKNDMIRGFQEAEKRTTDLRADMNRGFQDMSHQLQEAGERVAKIEGSMESSPPVRAVR